MNFNYSGYDLNFIQSETCHDDSAHLANYIYKFYSPVTHHHYIVRAEYHQAEVFTIKFYCKKHRNSDYKYSLVVNKGDLGNIMMTCAKVIPLLLQSFPTASFAFAAARTYDPKSKKLENLYCTQRYRLYCHIIPIKFGQQTFSHYNNDEISSYLLYNNRSVHSINEIQEMFKITYNGTDWL